ncbi:MAG: glycosyltransferase family 4 protein [Thermoleophilia bacterium]|nr:glycosyltransferase family 4 protein [Thermoleophilia bacterium]
MNDALRIIMSLAFYPRGGSAQVVRYLAKALGERGNRVTVCSGSLGAPGDGSHASTFFGNIDLRSLDFTEAAECFEQGRDPMAVPVPIHPSFEDRPGAPDRVFASIDEGDYARQLAAWLKLLEPVGRPDIHHVHHLTHVNDAVHALDDAPVVVHLHGTELKMLAAIREGAPASWNHAEAWERRLIAAAQRADRLVAVSPRDRTLAVDLLGVDGSSIDMVPNGVDSSRFSVRPTPPGERFARWRRWLVEEPQGWDESGVPGSISYTDDDLRHGFINGAGREPPPILLYVGRFLGFKRVPLLVRAYAEARASLGPDPPPLVIWGGHPGEWEGEHPHEVAESLDVRGVFFAGWRGHHDLALALNSADVLVAPSVDEPFGQVYLEAMACGLPVIATNSGGPPSFVNTDPARPTGWLVTPDSQDELAAAIVEAVGSPPESKQRGRRGRAVIERDFDWRQIAERFERIYRDAIAARSG